MIQRILLAVGLLFCSTRLVPSYTVGGLDTTANGGTGFGNATPGSAPGYVTTDLGGSTDLCWGSAIQPDGKTVVVGQKDTLMAIVRYNINGTIDLTFDSDGIVTHDFSVTSAIAKAVTVLPNGKIVVVGSVVNGTTKFFVAQFLPNGSLDTAGFNTAGTPGYVIQTVSTTSTSDIANAVAVDASGKIYVIGTSVDTQTNIFAARYTSAGVLDTTYNSTTVISGGGAGPAPRAGIALISITSAILAGNGAAIDSSGKLVIVGSTSVSTSMLIARLTSGTGATSGILDTTFDTDGYSTVNLAGTDVAYAVGFQSAGQIIVAGTTGTHAAVARFTTTGALDTSFGVGSSGYNITSGTATTARGLAIQQDDKIVIGGTAGIDFVIARYIADGSTLDTTFGTFGESPTSLGTTDVGNALSMQQNGSFIVAGTSGNDFGTARYLGNIPQGCMDYTYNPAVAISPGAPGFRTYPTDTTPTNKPQVKALQALSNGKVYVLTEDLAMATKSQIVQLNADGSTALTAVDIAQIGAADVIVDSQSRAIVVGGNGTNGWLYRSTSSTSLTPSFTTFTASQSASFKRVGQQTTGRIIVIGQSSSDDGLLIAYTESGALDTTFGSSGFTTMESTTFSDLLIDAQDNIYVSYLSRGNNTTYIAKYASNGVLATNFGTSGIMSTGWETTYYPSLLSFDNSGNIVIAAVNGSTEISFQRYAPTATSQASTTSLANSTTLLSSPQLTKLQCDTSNRLIFNGYDANDFIIGRLVAGSFTIDASFAPYAPYPGIMKTMYSTNNPSDSTTPKRVSNGVCIAPSGAILFGGYENISSSSTVSVVGQVVGYTSGSVYTQVARYPGALLTGTLNTSFGTNGALDLTTAASLPNGQAKAMYVLASGEMLVADANGTNTTLAQMTSGYAADTAFGGGDGLITLTGLITPTAMMIDPTDNIYVLGQNATPAAAVYKVNSGGTTGGTALVTTSLSAGYAIAQQASGRILVGGYDSINSSGVIVAYTPSGALDTSFNPQNSLVTPLASTNTVAGYWYTNIAHPVTSISIGSGTVADKIYYAYENGSGSAVVARLLENGTAVDSAFTFGTAIASVSSDTQIKMQLDASGNIVLVANTGSSNGIRAARYTAAGANSISTFTVIANTSGKRLENILTLSDGSTLILAAVPNATASSAFMILAQLTSSFTLDTNFNSLGSIPGLLTTNVPSSSYTPEMKDFYALDVIATGGILIAGDNSQTASSAHPYFANVVNTLTPTKVAQSATAFGAAGALDTTFNPAGTNAGFMNLKTELPTDIPSAGTQVAAVLQASNGSYYLGATGSTNSYITQMSDDDVQNSGWGTSGLVTISGKANLSAMMLTQTGNVCVVGGSGSSGSSAGWVVQYGTSTGSSLTSFAPTITLDAHYAVAQQSNGRILVAGKQNGFGTIIAYDPLTGAVDTTFGENGLYITEYTSQINAILVDASDAIYFVTNTNTTNYMLTVKITASGSSEVWGSTNTVAAFIAAYNHLVFDQSNNLVAFGLRADQALGIYVVNQNGTFVDNASFGSFETITSVIVDRQASTAGQLIFTGYNTGGSNSPYIGRILADLSNMDTSFGTGGFVTTSVPGSTATASSWNAAMINANGKITVAGYANISATNTPYVMRVYGDEFIGQYTTSVTAGTPGTLNASFATSGILSLIGNGQATSAVPNVVLPISNGSQYVAFSDGTLMRFTNGNILDTTYGTGGIAAASPAGVTDMLIDGDGQLVLVGTPVSGSGDAWIVRYQAGNSGALDTTFGSSGLVNFGSGTKANRVIEQSLSRYVVAGQISSGNGTLFAFTNNGTADTTFAVGASSTGRLTVNTVGNPIAMIADQYDRLICAYKTSSTAISLTRFTSSGELDTTFGSNGIIPTAISNADAATQVKLAFNATGNIVLVAHISTGIAVVAYANGTGTSVSHFQYTITTLTSPTLTSMICYTESGSLNDKVLVGGYQSGTNNMWVARITAAGGTGAAYGLDSSFGGGDGILTFNAGLAATPTARNLTSIALYGDGEISMVGTETSSTSPTNNPFMARAYNSPYVTQTVSCLDAKAQGTNDATLGAGVSPNYVANGITFFASNDGVNQIAKAVVVMQNGNANNILVAADGTGSTITNPSIYLNMFSVDGLLDTDFVQSDSVGTIDAGQSLLLSMFPEQYVNDMLTFTTASGVSKAILAGYAYNTTLSKAGSLVMQCNLTPDVFGLDTSFGGLNGNSLGVAFGDGKSLNTVGLQSTGRIITGGLDQNNNGLLLGYTAAGNLDQSFGQGGTFVQGATGVYASVIDSSDRLVIAYIVGTSPKVVTLARILADGSGLDTTFGTNGIVTTTIATAVSNSNLRLALDASGNIVVAAVVTDAASGTLFKIARYTSLGVLSGSVATIGSTMALTALTITKMLVDINNTVVVVGYDNATSDMVVVTRLTYTSGAYALDTTFNGTAGFIKYAVNGTSTQATAGGLIHPDGRIIIAGAQQ